MSRAGVQSKRLEKETQKMRGLLQSIPDPYDVDGHLRPEITANKLAYILIRHSQCLSRLTTALIVLTVILVIATIADIIFRLA